MCVLVVWIRHDDERSVTSRAIVHRPPARSLDRSIMCSIYVTRLVLRFTNNMLRALPVTPFSPGNAPGISRFTHPQGEPGIYIYPAYVADHTGVMARARPNRYQGNVSPRLPPRLCCVLCVVRITAKPMLAHNEVGVH